MIFTTPEATRSGQEALEVMTALRKQVSDLTRKGFYLESERKQLLEKIKAVQGVWCVCVYVGGWGWGVD